MLAGQGVLLETWDATRKCSSYNSSHMLMLSSINVSFIFSFDTQSWHMALIDEVMSFLI